VIVLVVSKWFVCHVAFMVLWWNLLGCCKNDVCTIELHRSWWDTRSSCDESICFWWLWRCMSYVWKLSHLT
jgi:hypothetical protein